MHSTEASLLTSKREIKNKIKNFLKKVFFKEKEINFFFQNFFSRQKRKEKKRKEPQGRPYFNRLRSKLKRKKKTF